MQHRQPHMIAVNVDDQRQNRVNVFWKILVVRKCKFG
jgi:hypothetical protein